MQYLSSYFQAANQNGYAGTFVWAVYADVPEVSLLLGDATPVADGSEVVLGYNFQWGQVCRLLPNRQ